MINSSSCLLIIKNQVERRLLLTIKSIIREGGDIYKITSNGHKSIDTCTRQNIRDEIEYFAKKEGETSVTLENVKEVVKVKTAVEKKVI